MLRVQPLKLGMKARVSSTANTNASLVNHRCATSRRVGSRNPQHFAIDRCENRKLTAYGQKTAAETVWVLGASNLLWLTISFVRNPNRIASANCKTDYKKAPLSGCDRSARL